MFPVPAINNSAIRILQRTKSMWLSVIPRALIRLTGLCIVHDPMPGLSPLPPLSIVVVLISVGLLSMTVAFLKVEVAGVGGTVL